VWNKKNAAAAPAKPNSFERSDHIVFGFPNRGRARFLAQSAPLGWHKSMALCRSWCAHMHKSYDMCRARSNSDTFRTECASQGGGFAQVFRARARFGETQNFGRFAQMHVHFFGACTSCSTRDHRPRGFGTVLISAK